jgi:hypothetical protein
MKIRTVDQFLDRVSADRVWRIREVYSLRSQCFAKGVPEHSLKALRRSFVPIAYAHWEGFVKKTAHYYLELIAMQGLRLGELTSPFAALYLWRECAGSLARGKVTSLVEVYDTLLAKTDQKVRIQYKDAISTNSNLDAKTLREICLSLGIVFDPFQTKELFINETLVGRRNHIAHGEEQDVSEADLEHIKVEVVALIDTFRNEVENAATSQAYRRPAP